MSDIEAAGLQKMRRKSRKGITMKKIWKFQIQKVVFAALATGILLSWSGCSEKNPREDFANRRKVLRAYEGAPPAIPHPVLKSGAHYCLNCHSKGTVFEKDAEILGTKNAVAKISPHPTWVNCLQCHVPQNDVALFHKNKFKTFRLAHVKKETIAGEEPVPPQMPHHMQNRENCVVCHLSKTADPSIIPKHGMRESCEACHMTPESLDIYGSEGE